MSPYDQQAGPGIGATLKDARRRRGMDLSEVEERTKIRVRYLRAIENEDWDILPGPAYPRLLRAYAHLGLDGEGLADEYRRAGSRAAAAARAVSGAGPAAVRAARGPSPSRALIVGVGVRSALVAVMAVIGATPGATRRRQHDGGKHAGKRGHPATEAGAASEPAGHRSARASTPPTSGSASSTAGQPLVDGQVLAAGAEEGPSVSGSFTAPFGAATVQVDADRRQERNSKRPSRLGYSRSTRAEISSS